VLSVLYAGMGDRDKAYVIFCQNRIYQTADRLLVFFSELSK
jgi:hypothetical protein